MLEAPVLDQAVLIAGLRRNYGMQVAALEFLPIGADSATAVYRAVDDAGSPYFVKLRRGAFDEIVVLLPALVVEDIALFSADLLESDAGGEDRAQSLRYLQANFVPGGTIERAQAADSAGM